MSYLKLRKIEKLYFGYEDIAKVLNITLSSARVSATRFIRSEFLVRLKRNVYILKEKWDSLDREDKFILANLIQVPSYISLMTAMDYYQITTRLQQSFFESIGINRTSMFEIEKNIFNYTKIDKKLYFGFLRTGRFFIATPEKAFLDALYLMSLKRYSFDLTSIDFSKLNILKLKKLVKNFPKKTQKLLEKYG